MYSRCGNRYISPANLRAASASTVGRRLACVNSTSMVIPVEKRGQESFWICNRFQISFVLSVSGLGSAYGNQPYRSFCEQNIPSSHARNRVTRQHVCQHLLVEQCALRSYICSIGRSLLLWGRPRWWTVALCSIQGDSRDLFRSAADCSLLLWGRPRWWTVALCPFTASLRNSLMPYGRFSIRWGGQ